jgi:hypothetical protein
LDKGKQKIMGMSERKKAKSGKNVKTETYDQNKKKEEGIGLLNLSFFKHSDQFQITDPKMYTT